MSSYKIIIHDRTYSSWSLSEDNSFHEVKIDHPLFHPAKHKLFTKDVFMYDNELNIVSLKYSHIRSGTPIAGVLLLIAKK